MQSSTNTYVCRSLYKFYRCLSLDSSPALHIVSVDFRPLGNGGDHHIQSKALLIEQFKGNSLNSFAFCTKYGIRVLSILRKEKLQVQLLGFPIQQVLVATFFA